jgi:hypothetical protein
MKRSGSNPPARSLSYFEEEPVDRHRVEQHLRDGFPASLREPGRAEISPATVHRDGHAGRTLGKRVGDQLREGEQHRLRVVALLLEPLPDGGIAQEGEVAIVELQIGAAGIGKGADRVAVGEREVVEQRLQAGIGVFGRPPSASRATPRSDGWVRGCTSSG